MGDILSNKKAKKLDFKRITYISVLILVLLLFFLFTKLSFSSFITALILFTISIFSKIYKHFTAMSFGFETVTFTAILFFFSYPFGIALLFSLIMLVLSTVISGHIGPAVFVEALIYILLGLLVLLLGDFSVLKAILLAVIYSLVLQAIALLSGYDLPRAVLNAIINIALNCFLFIRLGEFLIGVL